MVRTLLTLLALGMFAGVVVGCRASGAVDTRSAAQVSPAR